jgi:hypothetical protein
MHRMLAVVVLALVVVACGSSDDGKRPATTTTAQRQNLSGAVVIVDPDLTTEVGNGRCTGSAGYEPVSEGAEVVIRDESSRVVGNSLLEEGRPSGEACIFVFVVRDLPAAKFYSIAIADRGTVTYSYEEVAGNRWKVEMTIGA